MENHDRPQPPKEDLDRLFEAVYRVTDWINSGVRNYPMNGAYWAVKHYIRHYETADWPDRFVLVYRDRSGEFLAKGETLEQAIYRSITAVVSGERQFAA